MKKILEKIANQKQNLKKELKILKNNYIVIIYLGIIRGFSVKELHKQLYDATINKKNGYIKEEYKPLLNKSYQFAKKLKNNLPTIAYINKTIEQQYGVIAGGILALSMFAFDYLKKSDIEKTLSRGINEIADKYEEEAKNEAINGSIERNRESFNVFYLASMHDDSALDHEPYQGKMYIDENWRSVVSDPKVKKDIEKYIRSHDVKTMQWVIGKPVWFITRRNCRHYFKVLDSESVLTKSVTTLIDENDMHTPIGKRSYVQTIKHKMSKDWYKDIRNAELLLEKYKERLRLHEAMNKVGPTPILQAAITKDKILIAKWEKYIKERK